MNPFRVLRIFAACADSSCTCVYLQGTHAPVYALSMSAVGTAAALVQDVIIVNLSSAWWHAAVMDCALVTELGEGQITVHQNTQSPEVLVVYAALRHSVDAGDLLVQLCLVLDGGGVHNLGLRQLAIAVLHADVAEAEANPTVTRCKAGPGSDTVIFQLGVQTSRECPTPVATIPFTFAAAAAAFESNVDYTCQCLLLMDSCSTLRKRGTLTDTL